MLFFSTTLIYLCVSVIAAGFAIAGWREKRSGGQRPRGPAPGAGGQPSRRLPPAGPGGQLPPADPGHRHAAEAAPSRRPPSAAGVRRGGAESLLAYGDPPQGPVAVAADLHHELAELGRAWPVRCRGLHVALGWIVQHGPGQAEVSRPVRQRPGDHPGRRNGPWANSNALLKSYASASFAPSGARPNCARCRQGFLRSWRAWCRCSRASPTGETMMHRHARAFLGDVGVAFGAAPGRRSRRNHRR